MVRLSLPKEKEKSKNSSSGTAMVLRFTIPPPKFPGNSGEYVFCTNTLSRTFVGKRSKGTTLLRGSGEAIDEPSKSADEYLSPNPLT